MDRVEELLQQETVAWEELSSLVARLTPEQLEQPGMNEEGWSVKDLLWHYGCWSARTVREIERIREGTYDGYHDETDALNAEFLAEGRRCDLGTVKAEWVSARQMARQAIASLPEASAEAEDWFEESGPVHYRDHLRELRPWAERLTSGAPAPGADP